jgi:predicted 3-demethylubiquinone-9 3-methyltransferase (glyoxalase superfamily)
MSVSPSQRAFATARRSESARDRNAWQVLTAEAGVHGHGQRQGACLSFNDVISLYVDCKTQDEMDELWEKLSAGGKKSQGS